MIINIRERIKQFDDKTLDLLEKDLNKKPIITVSNLIGIFCGENYTSKEVEDTIIEFNLRLVNSNTWRLPKESEIELKSMDDSFWLEEDENNITSKKSLFLVMSF